ncbi:hypothetical protein MKW94_009354, partial [Papaver nudicaule]|nr:hypothetical protein [Papaver nudicaule]
MVFHFSLTWDGGNIYTYNITRRTIRPLAGELAVDFPGKKVTLVHSRPRLIDFCWTKVDLKSHSDGDKTYRTSTGETIVADIHFFCVGKPLSSSWIKDSVFKEGLDARGRVMVDEHLTMKGCKNVFAIGDITDIP